MQAPLWDSRPPLRGFVEWHDGYVVCYPNGIALARTLIIPGVDDIGKPMFLELYAESAAAEEVASKVQSLEGVETFVAWADFERARHAAKRDGLHGVLLLPSGDVHWVR